MALAHAITPEHARTRSPNDVEIEGCTRSEWLQPWGASDRANGRHHRPSLKPPTQPLWNSPSGSYLLLACFKNSRLPCP
jgi:hypothetical protein